jgi:hypothetical protein
MILCKIKDNREKRRIALEASSHLFKVIIEGGGCLDTV